MILICDDNKTFLKIIKFYFNKYFPLEDLITTDNQQEILDYIDIIKVKLIIVDYMMPTIDGIELAKKIKAKDKNIKILLCSAFYNDTFVGYLKEDKKFIDDIIPKPLFVEEFKRKIKNYI